jgi:hypothetical protein
MGAWGDIDDEATTSRRESDQAESLISRGGRKWKALVLFPSTTLNALPPSPDMLDITYRMELQTQWRITSRGYRYACFRISRVLYRPVQVYPRGRGEKKGITMKTQDDLPLSAWPIRLQGDSLAQRAFVWQTSFPLAPSRVAALWGTWAPERLLVLIDRQGSMAPFHGWCEEIRAAVSQLGSNGGAVCHSYYFHNELGDGLVDEGVLAPLAQELFPRMDAILDRIPPLCEGYLYADGELNDPVLLADILERYARGASVLILSDAGAGRGFYNTLRLVGTLSFVKGLAQRARACVWLNPLPPDRWKHNTAGELARHLPMFPLDEGGLRQALRLLRQGHQEGGDR